MASALCLAQNSTIFNCSKMFAPSFLRIFASLPSARINLGNVPVTLVIALIFFSLKPAPINRVTLDFPLVPLI